MSRIIVARTIQAPVQTVFDAVTNIERLPESSPEVVRVEFLTDTENRNRYSLQGNPVIQGPGDGDRARADRVRRERAGAIRY